MTANRFGEPAAPAAGDRDELLLRLITELIGALQRLRAAPQVQVLPPNLDPLLQAMQAWSLPAPVVNVPPPVAPVMDLTPLRELLEELRPPEHLRIHEDDLDRIKPDITVAGATAVQVKDKAGVRVDPADLDEQKRQTALLDRLVNGPQSLMLSAQTPDVGSGAWTTIAALTAPADVKVIGFNCDVDGGAAFNYRMRLIIGSDAEPIVQFQEQLSTADNSATPVRLDVAEGERVAVQVRHAEVAAMAFRATINYEQ